MIGARSDKRRITQFVQSHLHLVSTKIQFRGLNSEMIARLETPDSIWKQHLCDDVVFSTMKGYRVEGRRTIIPGYSYIHSAT